MGLQHDTYPSINSLGYHHYFLCNYKPRTYGPDDLSRSVLRFKNKLENDLSAWIACSVEELHNVVDKSYVVVRALHSNELSAKSSSLDVLGHEFSREFGCAYRPDLIAKSRLTQSLKSLNRKERFSELDHVYQFQTNEVFRDNSFLIIDDVLTTGTTAVSIAEAISRHVGKRKISFFTLARVDYQSELNANIDLKGGSYNWKPSQGWSVVEDDGGVPQYSFEELKKKILSDSF